MWSKSNNLKRDSKDSANSFCVGKQDILLLSKWSLQKFWPARKYEMEKSIFQWSGTDRCCRSSRLSNGRERSPQELHTALLTHDTWCWYRNLIQKWCCVLWWSSKLKQHMAIFVLTTIIKVELMVPFQREFTLCSTWDWYLRLWSRRTCKHDKISTDEPSQVHLSPYFKLYRPFVWPSVDNDTVHTYSSGPFLSDQSLCTWILPRHHHMSAHVRQNRV